jgi:hypothetical protein
VSGSVQSGLSAARRASPRSREARATRSRWVRLSPWPRHRQRDGADARGGLVGAPGRIRTCDARFRKPTLYPLSYGGWLGLWLPSASVPSLLPRSGCSQDEEKSPARLRHRLRQTVPDGRCRLPMHLGPHPPTPDASASREETFTGSETVARQELPRMLTKAGAEAGQVELRRLTLGQLLDEWVAFIERSAEPIHHLRVPPSDQAHDHAGPGASGPRASSRRTTSIASTAPAGPGAVLQHRPPLPRHPFRRSPPGRAVGLDRPLPRPSSVTTDHGPVRIARPNARATADDGRNDRSQRHRRSEWLSCADRPPPLSPGRTAPPSGPPPRRPPEGGARYAVNSNLKLSLIRTTPTLAVRKQTASCDVAQGLGGDVESLVNAFSQLSYDNGPQGLTLANVLMGTSSNLPFTVSTLHKY